MLLSQQNPQRTDRYLPVHIRRFLPKKRRARRHWQASLYPSDPIILDGLTNQLKHTLSPYNSELFKHHTEIMTTDDHSLRRTTKTLILQILWTKTRKETVNCFAQHLHSVFTPHSDHHIPFHSDILNDLKDPLENDP